jgi:hypothetical protein
MRIHRFLQEKCSIILFLFVLSAQPLMKPQVRQQRRRIC